MDAEGLHFVILFGRKLNPLNGLIFDKSGIINTVIMKNRSIALIFLALIMFLSGHVLRGQSTTTNQIVSAVRNADAAGLAKYFNSTVDLELGNSDGNYSKKQAEIILKDFFQKNPVQSFSINHEGSSNDGSKYMIGSCVGKNKKKFRVYILLKNKNDGLLITQLQFEEE